MGAIQLRGKVQGEQLRAKRSAFLRLFARPIAERSVDFWVMTENLALPGNRVPRRRG